LAHESIVPWIVPLRETFSKLFLPACGHPMEMTGGA